MKNLKRFFHDRRFYIGVAVVGLVAAVAFGYNLKTFDYTGGHVKKIFERIDSNLAQVSNPANVTALPMPINKLAGYVYLMNPSGLFPTSGKYLEASHVGDLTQYFLGYWMYANGYSPSSVGSFASGLTSFLEQNLVQDDGSFNASNMKAALYGALSASVDVGDSIEPDQSQMNGYKRMNEPAYIFHLAQQYNRQSVLHGLVYSITRQEAVIAGIKHEILTRQCKDINELTKSGVAAPWDYNLKDDHLYYKNITVRQKIILNSLNTLLREYRKMSCLQLYTELTNAQLAVINDEIQLLSLSNQYEQLNMADKAAIGK
ncbi:MAG TPA: hypothetical protein ENO30_01365 [Thermodesulfobium narugense]|nr:hypothetical protein [Thermodesulfobium narugense]